MKVDLQDPRNDTELELEDDYDMPNTWTAKFYGSCLTCTEKVEPGQECVWVGEKGVAHAVCPESLDIDLRNDVCPDCHFELPASGVCGYC